MTVLTVGEALVGYVARAGSLRGAEEFRRFAGGAELNVTVALHRLGTKARWASVLGDDAHGDYLTDQIAGLGVGTHIVRQPGTTAVMFKAAAGPGDPEVLQVRHGTAFARHADQLLSDTTELMDGIEHLHLTGIVLGISPEARVLGLALLDAALERGCTVSFDPNIRAHLWPDRQALRSVINSVAECATVVLPGVDEGRLLTGSAEPEAIAAHYLGAGVPEVVIKLGAAGAIAFTSSGSAASQRFDVHTVDTVGAGDGFAAGYLDAFCAGADLQTRLDRAAAVGALVTTRPGDLEAMPERAEVEDLVATKTLLPRVRSSS